MSGKPTVISTFAGCGGSSLGYHLAGFKELLAVEFDDNVVETFKLNFPNVPVFHGDIANLSVEKCCELAKIKPGELDVFDGSPPCQGFSSANMNRNFKDKRNNLFLEYVRLLKGLEPKVFIMENVKGMIQGVMKKKYLEIIKTLRNSGYKVTAQVLNSCFFGVPQRRERIIFIGIREDLRIEPSLPKPQTTPIPLRVALANVDNSQDFDARKFPKFLIDVGKEYDSFVNDRLLLKKLFLKYKKSSGGYISTNMTFWNKPSPTVIKQEIGCTGLIHPDRQRYFTIPELKRISSFSDDFRFPKHLGRKNAVERMGNCVPPLLMKAIALHIKEQILPCIKS